jgi:hypothetical protein
VLRQLAPLLTVAESGKAAPEPVDRAAKDQGRAVSSVARGRRPERVALLKLHVPAGRPLARLLKNALAEAYSVPVHLAKVSDLKKALERWPELIANHRALQQQTAEETLETVSCE